MLLLLQALTLSALAARADTVRPVHDALHYDITLVPSDTAAHLLGETQIVWRLRSTEPVTMALDSAMRVIRVLVDGRENTRLSRTMYGRSASDVVVPHDKVAGDSITTRVRYRGTPRDGWIVGRNVHGDRTAFADNWPDRAHLWFPAQDHPSDKATVAFHVQAPLDQQVIANGVLEKIDTLPYGHATWHYRLDVPIPTYSMVVGVGRMSRTALPDAACAVRCVPLAVWSYPQDSAYAVAGPFRRAADMVEYFSRLIGPFPYPRLAHVESSTRFGGMENATAIFYDEKRYRDRTLDETVVAHETAHQWFGDAVTEADWHHLWLSEGFATYLAALWVRHADGDTAFAREMRQGADAVFRSPASERPILDTAATDLLGLLNSNAYLKAAWMLHQLRGLVGDSAFVQGLRRYYTAHRDGTALSVDVARAMSEAAGRGLEWYFQQALLQPGYPMVDVRWRHDGANVVLDIRQTQKPEWGTYRIPGLEIRLDDRVVRVDLSGRRLRHVVRGVARRPAAVVVDPNGWWLMRHRVTRER